MSPQVDILLAVYNGSEFLEEQLLSIERQTFSSWRLIIRDDGSSDTSLKIIEKFARKHPSQVIILKAETRLGVVGNFSALMQASTAPYICFCDQDDVWKEDKIAVQLDAIRQLESIHSAEIPLLVHTDLQLVDQQLKPIADSFWRYTHLYPKEATSLNRLLVQNVVTGCALICNRALVERSLPIPPQALMHDWWLALVASGCGHIQAISQPTLFYRQHKKNTLGAVRFGSLSHFKLAYQRLHKMTEQKYLQAKLFLDKYENQLCISQRTILQAYLSLKTVSFCKSRWMIWKYKFLKQGFLRQCMAWMFLKQP